MRQPHFHFLGGKNMKFISKILEEKIESLPKNQILQYRGESNGKTVTGLFFITSSGDIFLKENDRIIEGNVIQINKVTYENFCTLTY